MAGGSGGNSNPVDSPPTPAPLLASVLPKPVVMRDGRRMFKLPTAGKTTATTAAEALVARCKARHVVLIADNMELRAYLPRGEPAEIIAEIQRHAQAVLGVLHRQSDARMATDFEVK